MTKPERKLEILVEESNGALTLFRPGLGEGILTARTLDAFDAYNLISELKPPNLVTLHKM